MVQVPAPNVPLLWAVLQHIDEQPLSWTQSAWAVRGLFGDMHCFAGHAVRISGHRFAWSDETETCCALDEGGLRVYVGSLACDLLRLTEGEAEECTILILACFGCKPRSASKLVSAMNDRLGGTERPRPRTRGVIKR